MPNCKQCDSVTQNKFFCDDECQMRWVYQKYINDELGTYEIGRILGCDPKTVYRWLKINGIPTRPRGTGHEKNPAFIGDRTGVNNSFYGRKHTPESIAKMSESSKGSAPWLRGDVHHLYGKRGDEIFSWKGGITPERQAFNGRVEWKRASESVWQRDGATCQLCHKSKAEYPKLRLDVHHIVGFDDSVELRSALNNLVLLCRPCHMWVHSKANVENKYLGEIKHE